MCELPVYKICAKIIFVYFIYDIIKKIFIIKDQKNISVKKPIIFNNGTNQLINLLTPWGESMVKLMFYRNIQDHNLSEIHT